MQTAGARILPEDDKQEMSREAVLLQWERKIEQAERRPNRFERAAESSRSAAESSRSAVQSSRSAAGSSRSAAGSSQPDQEPRAIGLAAAPNEDATHRASPRFQHDGAADSDPPVAERRTITITGRPGPPRRRSVVESQLAQPDRIALWAFLLGLFLVAVAAGTAHA
jgi:hypothetical protein